MASCGIKHSCVADPKTSLAEIPSEPQSKFILLLNTRTIPFSFSSGKKPRLPMITSGEKCARIKTLPMRSSISKNIFFFSSFRSDIIVSFRGSWPILTVPQHLLGRGLVLFLHEDLYFTHLANVHGIGCYLCRPYLHLYAAAFEQV